jgi:hypothetical protein
MATFDVLLNELVKLRNLELAYYSNSYKAAFNAINNTPKLAGKLKQQRILSLNTFYKKAVSQIENKYTLKVNALKQSFFASYDTIYPTTTIVVGDANPSTNPYKFTSKHALVIGINYKNTAYALNGCINDALNIQTYFKKQSFDNIVILTDDTPKKPTKANIIKELTNLLSHATSGDFVCVTYSGHGSFVDDANNNETDKHDEAMVPLDFNLIIDDTLKSIIDKNLKANVTLFLLFDCCHSGTILDLKYQYLDSEQNNTSTINNNEVATKGTVIMISGCTDAQTSEDAYINNQSQGALTWALLDVLNASDHKISWKNLIQTMRTNLAKSKYTQIPQLSSGKACNIDDTVFI